jgi:calcium-dependent protein kinase
MDSSNKGQVEYLDFLNACVNVQNFFTKDRIHLFCKSVDLDGDGKISVEELKAIFSGGTFDNEDSEETKSVWLKIM